MQFLPKNRVLLYLSTIKSIILLYVFKGSFFQFGFRIALAFNTSESLDNEFRTRRLKEGVADRHPLIVFNSKKIVIKFLFF